MADEAHVDQSADRSKALRTATRGALIAAALIALSRVTGLVRDIIIAAIFGQGRNTDCFKAALQLPDLLFFLIAGGVLSSSFVPVYAEYRRERGEDEAWELASVVLTWWLSFALLIVVAFEWFAGPLVRVFGTPGALWTPAEYEFVLRMTRIVLPAQIAFFAGGVLMGLQWVRHDFVIPGVGPTVYNLGIMIGGALGGLTLGREQGVIGMAWGALIGAFLGNFLLQLWAVRRYGGRLRVSFNPRHPGARRVLVLMLPVIFSLSMPLIDVQINKWFAAKYFGDGVMTAIDTAYRVMLLPVGIVGQSVATSFYATLTNAAAAGQMVLFRQTVVLGLRQLLIFCGPAIALLVVLRVPLVALLFERGAFGREDTLLVASALGYYALGVWFWCAEQLLGRAFYALKDTRTPPWVGTGVTVVFVFLDWALLHLFSRWFGPSAGYLGLALATTLAAGLYCGLLLWLLRRRLGRLEGRQLWATGWRVALASAACGLGAWALALAPQRLGLQSVWVQGICGVVGGLGIYAWSARWLGLSEVAAVLQGLHRRLSRPRPDQSVDAKPQEGYASDILLVEEEESNG